MEKPLVWIFAIRHPTEELGRLRLSCPTLLNLSYFLQERLHASCGSQVPNRLQLVLYWREGKCVVGGRVRRPCGKFFLRHDGKLPRLGQFPPLTGEEYTPSLGSGRRGKRGVCDENEQDSDGMLISIRQV